MEKEQDFENMVIDLNSLGGEAINENMIKVFAAWMQYLLEKMFKGTSVPVRVQGNRIQIMRFTDALTKEKLFMNAIKKYGLDDPMVFKRRHQLKHSIAKFEKETGINWPLK